MNNMKSVFADYLATEGLKMTPQRMVILNTFTDVNLHVSSEELYELVKKQTQLLGRRLYTALLNY